jgi:cAMP-dependent protein kinase regulator
MKDYKDGDYFGERALLTNENRAANVVVTSNECVVLSLERETFIRLLGSLQDILKRNMEDYCKFVK